MINIKVNGVSVNSKIVITNLRNGLVKELDGAKYSFGDYCKIVEFYSNLNNFKVRLVR